jgi:hypothetical protein
VANALRASNCLKPPVVCKTATYPEEETDKAS